MTLTRGKQRQLESGWKDRENEETKAYVFALVNEVIVKNNELEAEIQALKGRIEILERCNMDNEPSTDDKINRPSNLRNSELEKEQMPECLEHVKVNQEISIHGNTEQCTEESNVESDNRMRNNTKSIVKELNEIQVRERVREEELKLLKDSIGKLKEGPEVAWKEIVREDPELKKVMAEVVQKNLDADFQNTMVVKAMPIVRQEIDRFRSVIVIGIEEDCNKTAYERNEDDKFYVRNLLGALNMGWAENTMVSMYRIGSITNTSKPRLMRITFARDDIQKKLLARKQYLKQVTAFRTVYIRRDKSARERWFRRESNNTTYMDRLHANEGQETFLGIGTSAQERPY